MSMKCSGFPAMGPASFRQKTMRNKARDVLAVLLAIRHPQTAWYAKALAAAVVAYALSPIDLIPDIIPVLGLLDDLVLVPVGLLLARKMIPPDAFTLCRQRAEKVVGITSGCPACLVWES